MRTDGSCIVVTGAAGGIGAALARRFVADGARTVVVSDVDAAGATRVASETGGDAFPCDVTDPDAIARLVDEVEARHGPIDLFCSNAGVAIPGGVELDDAPWRLSIDVNVMAHVWAARVLIPRMVARGGGHLLQTASAAGLLTQLGSAPYSVTKHAAVALAEWIAITYGEQGIKVSVLCPQAVRTNMTAGVEGGGVAGVDGMLEPDDVAEAVAAGLARDDFLILPHPQVHEYVQRKAADHARWIGGMQRLQRRFPHPV
ncbi:MAG TPA: SDR family oxidoreductase [Acidimicrobiia bacterium]|nr:SDR family oxidoreductase [Acidimicrobiia bacterium]